MFFPRIIKLAPHSVWFSLNIREKQATIQIAIQVVAAEKFDLFNKCA